MYSNLELFVNLVTTDIGQPTDTLSKNPNGWNGTMPGINQDGRDYVLDTHESGAIPGRLKIMEITCDK